MANLLFYAFAAALVSLVFANVTVTALRLWHKEAEAARVRRTLGPIVSYFRLGGKSHSDSARAKHA